MLDQFKQTRSLILSLALLTVGCAHAPTAPEAPSPSSSFKDHLQPVKVEGPVSLILKADPNHIEKVTYLHRSKSQAYEDSQLRQEHDDSVEFKSEAETKNVEPANPSGVSRFTQIITVTSKDGTADMHDFAMPELGEKLEVVADSRGNIIKSGDYPNKSIFYVPPVSLPPGKVSVGDTWTMVSEWLSLEEMVPYKLDMVSILKGFYKCGTDTCAEIEISGVVTIEGEIIKSMLFRSVWQGSLYFALNTGTVVWSRTEADERLLTENVRRDSQSCLESVLQEPADIRLPGTTKPTCDGWPKQAEMPPDAPKLK